MIKYKRYHISNRIKDSNIHKKDIIDAVFLPRSDTLLINEYGTKVLRIYNPKTGKNEKIFELDNFLNPTSVIKNATGKNSYTWNRLYVSPNGQTLQTEKTTEEIDITADALHVYNTTKTNENISNITDTIIEI